MRLRYDKRIIYPFILLTIREKKGEKIKRKSERPKKGLKDKI
jgi:hypothetical protein